MGTFALIYIIALLIVLTNASTFRTEITKILTPKVASEGLLILDTSLIKFRLVESLIKNFPLSVKNVQTNQTQSLNCFLLQFKYGYKESKIGCQTFNQSIGKYRLVPLNNEINIRVNLLTDLTIKISENFDFSSTFEVTSGNEIYFYSLEEQFLSFGQKKSEISLEFNVFEKFTGSNLTMILESDEDNSFQFYCDSNPKSKFTTITCKLFAEDFPQDSQIQKYKVYILDSLNNKKNNYFVPPIDIYLDYI